MKKTKYISFLLVCCIISIFAPSIMVSASTNNFETKQELSKNEPELVDVIIQTTSYDYSALITEIESFGGLVTNEFEYAKGLGAKVQRKFINKLRVYPGVKKISIDNLVFPSSSTPDFVNKEIDEYLNSETSVSMVGRDILSLNPTQVTQMLDVVPEAYWNYISMNAAPVWSEGYMGQDSLVVVIDTGVFDQHAMLKNSVIGGINLSPDSAQVGAPDWNSPLNRYHGTHCAGIIAGSSMLIFEDANDLLYQSYVYHTGIAWTAGDFGLEEYDSETAVLPLFGTAPLAQIYGIKVFPASGGGVPSSYVIAAIEYSIKMHEEGLYDVDVISMSLGGGDGYEGRDLESQVVDYATSIGITVVAAAGNSGPSSLTVGTPAAADTAIAVGAVADPVNTRIFWDIYYQQVGMGDYLFTSENPQLIYFSSRGPTSDGRAKPEICATGVFVLSAITPDPNSFAWASGTSMACPAVAGAIAMLNSYGEEFDATPYDYEQALVDGAVWIDGYKDYEQGAGNLNALNSFNALVQQSNEDLLGDTHPELNKIYPLIPEKPQGTNTHIVGSGSYNYMIESLSPGFPIEFYFKATLKTEKITIKFTDIDLGVDLGLNSFELHVQSPVRTSSDYIVESFNINGDTTVIIENYNTTWTTENTWGTNSFLETRIQPGYYKVLVENDWTSFDDLSGKLEINVEEKPIWDYILEDLCPDEIYLGTIAQDEILGTYIFDSGTKGQIIELWWTRNWLFYPTCNLDLNILWSNGTDWFSEDIAGASLRSPEGVYLPEAVYSEVSIIGENVYIFDEPWLLCGYYL